MNTTMTAEQMEAREERAREIVKTTLPLAERLFEDDRREKERARAARRAAHRKAAKAAKKSNG